MKNTLKIVLIIVGLGLVIYGVYTLFNPAVPKTTEETSAYSPTVQSMAIVGLGLLSLISGFAFRKR